MFKKKELNLWLLSASVFFISIVMLTINLVCYRFPGLFYFDPAMLASAVFFMILRYGVMLQFNIDRQHTLVNALHEASRYTFVIALILLGTSAVQYTPFPPIDKQIISLEQSLHLDMQAAMAWLYTHITFKNVAQVLYDSLALQLLIVPLFVLFNRKYDVLYEFYCLVLITWILGSMLYYFFPTMGPASVVDSPYFIAAQRHTGLKFWQIHHYIQPDNPNGGMIAMPSFHVIWAWLCVFMLRGWPILCASAGIVNALLVVACVFLGWHYFVDVFASGVVIIIAHRLLSLRMKHRGQCRGVSCIEK